MSTRPRALLASALAATALCLAFPATAGAQIAAESATVTTSGNTVTAAFVGVTSTLSDQVSCELVLYFLGEPDFVAFGVAPVDGNGAATITVSNLRVELGGGPLPDDDYQFSANCFDNNGGIVVNAGELTLPANSGGNGSVDFGSVADLFGSLFG